MAEEPSWRRLEKRAEQIYDEMYESGSSLGFLSEIKECFHAAIEEAAKEGLTEEVARMEARRDHILAVYRRQFVQPPQASPKAIPRLVGAPRPFDVLKGLSLSIIRRAADMLVLHFGEIRPHHSGQGTIGEFAFHVQCPWRFARPDGILTGSGDLWHYAGPGERPENWSYEDGNSLQDLMFSELMGPRDAETASWYNREQRLTVKDAFVGPLGDVALDIVNQDCLFQVFPDSGTAGGEAWRFFASDGGEHLVYSGTTERAWK